VHTPHYVKHKMIRDSSGSIVTVVKFVRSPDLFCLLTVGVEVVHFH
jgi:hypothetical protein